MGLDVTIFAAKRSSSKIPSERFKYETGYFSLPSGGKEQYYRKMWSIVEFFQVDNCEYVQIEYPIMEEFLRRCKRIVNENLSDADASELIEDIGTYIFVSEKDNPEVAEAEILIRDLEKLINSVDWSTENLYITADW